MTIRKSKGKWCFGEKDTWSLDDSLSPIILAGLTRFRDVLLKRDAEGKIVGYPSVYSDQQGLNEDECFQAWIDDLNRMIYAFDENNHPDAQYSEYNFEFSFEDHGVYSRIVVDNQEEFDRYLKDCKIHEEKVKVGRRLFIEMYDNLWW